jgi:hypothetical protein
MPTLIEIYEKQAEGCLYAAAKTANPKHRDILLKLASAWREDAEALKRGEELRVASSPQKAKVLRSGAEGVPSDPAPTSPRRRSA